MATINGGTIGEGALTFLGGTVYTPAGATPGSEPMVINAGQTVVGQDVIVSCSDLGNHTGALTLRDSSIDINPTGNLPAIAGTWIMDNVVVYSNVSGYRAFGNWAGASTVYNWDDVSFACNVDNTNALGFMSPFFLQVTSTTGLNGISFWNRADLSTGNAGGAVLQTTSNLIWDSPTFGPFGLQLNSGEAGARCVLRVSNTFTTGTISTAQGYMVNDDRTAWGQIDDASYIVTVSIDSGANVMFLNTLPGLPANSLSFTYANIVGATASGSMVRNATVTNPVCTDANVIYTIEETSVANAFEVPATLPTSSDFNLNTTSFTGRRITNPANGFGFLNQVKEFTAGLTGGSSVYGSISNADTVSSVAIAAIPSIAYRQYAWLQQPSDALFGRFLNLTPPQNNANAAQIAAARLAGYNTINVAGDGTTSWGDSLDANSDIDPYIAEIGFSTVAAASASYNAASTARAASHIAGQMKEVAYTSALTPNAANDKVTLPYSVSGTTIDLGNRTLTIGGGESRAYDTTTASIKANYISPDDFINTVQASEIVLTGTGWNTTDTKVLFVADSSSGITASSIQLNSIGLTTTQTGSDLSLSSSVVTGSTITAANNINVSNATITESQLLADDNINVSGLTGTISDSRLLADNINNATSAKFVENNTFGRAPDASGSDVLNINFTGLSGTIAIDTLLGDNWDFEVDGQVVLTSNAAVIVTVDADDITKLGITLTQGNTVDVGNITYSFPDVSNTITYEIPSTLRNGTFAVKVIDGSGTGTTLVAPVVVSGSTPATYQYAHSSTTYNGTDAIRIYWRPNATATAAYNTTIFNIPTGTIASTVTMELMPSKIASVLWEDLFPSTIVTDVGTASMSLIEDGDEPLASVARAELRYANADGILNDPQSGAVNSLYVTLTSLNDDDDYLQRMIDNELTADYITSSGAETLVDGAYCYLDSADSNVQTITAVTNSNPAVFGADGTTVVSGVTQAQFVPKTFTTSGGGGTGTTPTVIVLPNPAGATPGQIAAAVTSATADIKTNQSVLLTATQRGAVKAATYSAGTLIP